MCFSLVKNYGCSEYAEKVCLEKAKVSLFY